MDELTGRIAPIRAHEGMDGLVAALGAGNARYVGGIVRDALLGIDAADIDLATVHPPEQVVRRLTAAGIRTVPTGLAHGTITALLPSGPVEVTSLRRDVETDGRHAVVAFTDRWQEDAARRDFTINALYADPGSGAVFDWFGGLDDLAAGRVRFIGDPYRRIAEDHLRILRFFRFHARFGDAPDPDGLAACTARANDLMALSRERIAAELLKLLVAARAVPATALMVERGILRPVLPEIDARGVARLERLARREAAAGLSPDKIRRLAALLPPEPDTGEKIAARLKLSNLQRKRLATALDPASDAPRPLAYRIGWNSAVDRLLLSDAPDDAVAEEYRALDGWTPPRLPLTGGALVARGVAAGPDVARLLRQIEDQWVAEGFPDADRVEALADHMVRTWRSAR